jgi:hypothetical protein
MIAVGCVSADGNRHAAGAAAPPPPEREARRAIGERIARTVEVMKRADVDALADGGGARRRPDGAGEMTRDEARATIAAQLAGVERTIDLTVRVDSLRMTSDSSALVYTSQRWERLLRAGDGSRHVAVTRDWLEQEWTRGPAGWRGTGIVRAVRLGTATLDGMPFVVATP